MQKSIFALVLLTAPLLHGCVVPAAVGVGVLVSQEMIEDNTYIGHINADVNTTWAQVKTTLSRRSEKAIDVDDNQRKATADIDGATVKVAVETYDLNVCVMRVSAKKYALPDNDTAKSTFDRILADLSKNK